MVLERHAQRFLGLVFSPLMFIWLAALASLNASPTVDFLVQATWVGAMIGLVSSFARHRYEFAAKSPKVIGAFTLGGFGVGLIAVVTDLVLGAV
ncbi:MAG: hypothetical protein ACRDKV_06085 [Solirubrobacterales bacterium]